jgi:hypothetical protein
MAEQSAIGSAVMLTDRQAGPPASRVAVERFDDR